MSSRIVEIEAEYGMPIRRVLEELYQQHGTLDGVADALGISQGTLSQWLWKLGLKIEKRLVET